MKAKVSHPAMRLVLPAFVFLLVSCGGGGGGGGGGGPGTPPATPVALTAGNAQLATDEVLNASLTFVTVGGSNTGTGVVPLSARPNVRPRTRLLVGVLRQQLGALNARSPLAATLVPAAPVTTFCDNGPDGFVTTDAASTSSTVTFTNCSSAGETINGTLMITNIMSPSAGTVTAHVSHSLTFVQAGVPTVISSGDFDINHTTAGNVVTDTLTGGPVTVQVDNDIAILSGFTLTSAVDTSTQALTDSFAGTIATGVMGGSVTVTTPTVFQTVGTSEFPNTGQLLITGAGNSAVRFTVLGDETLADNQVRIEVDGNGDGTFDATVETTWALL